MTVERVETHSAAETEALGARIAAALEPGAIVVVAGDLGSGKTTLVRGACRALGVEEPVTSPTFTIGQRYRGAGVTVSHLDLYRLPGLEQEDPALLDDYLAPDAIAFVEWPAAASGRLRGPVIEVRMRHGGGERREIELDSASSRA
jgi:tRNA threonylcarbamoyladenosine biosynthesis protein TsaE